MNAIAPSVSVSSQASIDVRVEVLPRAKWATERGPQGLAFRPIKGTWYGHILRGKARHDVSVVPMIACPSCNGILFLSHTEAAARFLRNGTGLPVPIVHRIDHLGKVSPDVKCHHGACSFHRKVYLDKWNKTKTLYAIAYVEGEHGEILIDYTHAVDRREAMFHFGPRRNVRIIDMAPAVGFFLNEKTGRLTAD